MKICNECKQNKNETDFYKDHRSSTGRREAKCKDCRNKAMKNNDPIFYEISYIGNRKCKICKIIKPIIDFPVNKSIKLGRMWECSSCHNLKINTKRRESGPIFLPLSKSLLIPDQTEYKTSNCEICNNIFNMCRNSHKRCEICSDLVRNIQSHLLQKRNGKKISIEKDLTPNQLAILIATKYSITNLCEYCARPFNETNTKQIDHIKPIHLGGIHSINNINICCKECNFSKNRSNLEQWLHLCKIISCQENIVFIKKINIINYNNSEICEICGINVKINHWRSKYCTDCATLVKSLNSTLTSTRNKKSTNCDRKTVIDIAKIWIRINRCCYCNRNFTESNHKSIDHIIPFCNGGTNEYKNLNVCCLECNRAKSILKLEQWVELCKLITNNYFLTKNNFCCALVIPT